MFKILFALQNFNFFFSLNVSLSLDHKLKYDQQSTTSDNKNPQLSKKNSFGRHNSWHSQFLTDTCSILSFSLESQFQFLNIVLEKYGTSFWKSISSENLVNISLVPINNASLRFLLPVLFCCFIIIDHTLKYEKVIHTLLAVFKDILSKWFVQNIATNLAVKNSDWVNRVVPYSLFTVICFETFWNFCAAYE